MHKQDMPVGDQHADLWGGMTALFRHVDGPVDVTVGEHPELGLCVVSHYGFENRIEWFTQWPIQLDNAK